MKISGKQVFYIVCGIIPTIPLFLLSILGCLYGIGAFFHGLINGENMGRATNIPLIVLCVSMIFSFCCGWQVVFRKHNIKHKAVVISGLLLGITACMFYVFVQSDLPWLRLLFLLPSVVGTCLVLEVVQYTRGTIKT